MHSQPTRKSNHTIRIFISIGLAVLIGIVAVFWGLGTPTTSAAASDIFFSEYIEGSSFNKALEIYNGTGAPVNLATGNYILQLYSNGSATASQTMSLSGTIADGDVFVIAHASANAAILAQADVTNSSVINHNGDDAFVLRKGGAAGPIVDVIGQVGFDPGTEWGTGLTSTADNTIRRKSTICQGDTNPSDVFDPATEWDGFANDTFTGFGAHTASCGGGGDTAPSVTATVPANNATDVAKDSNVTITFNEAVNVTGNWFQISCATSGTRQVADTSVSGGPTTFVIDPNADFASGEFCTVTVVGTLVTDQDANDPPDTMAANHAFSFTTVSPSVTSGIVVISQVYGGGGNAGATLKNDYVEIINHSAAPVNLSGWSLQIASASPATNWQKTDLTNFTLQPGQYYLIQQSQGAGGTDDLPTPDASGGGTVSSTSGKIALVSNQTLLTGVCPVGGAIIDFVGYGAESCAETSAAGILTNTTANLRKNNGCFDSNNNSIDFATGATNPRNSSSPINSCTGLFAIGSAQPSTVTTGNSTTLSVYVSPAQDPNSTGISVVADLSSIGGSATQSFAGAGNTFTFVASIPVSTTPGPRLLPVTVSDSQLRITNATIALTVQEPHVTISQIYGGGGNAGATYNNDFVELYNPTANTVDLTGWSLQYTSATGDSWDFTTQPIGGYIEPGQYYLISLGAGNTPAPPLPPANILGEINMSGTTGKVALVNNFDPLEGVCPIGDVNIVDFVGYGANANCSETANAPAPSNTTSISRINGGATDNDNNQAEFVTGAPNPRRTAPIVELGPLVFSSDPRNNGSNAPRDATITLNFTEPVDVVGTWFNISCTSSGLHNDATTATVNKTWAITPNANFQPGEQCTVTIFKDQVHDQDTDDSGPNTDTLNANYVATFTVATGTAPPYPSSVHLDMGNPNGATANPSFPNNYLMEKPEFALSYNRDMGRPNWVSWHLSDEWIGTLQRIDTFRPDPAVLPEWYRVQAFDFSNSGFDRGHMTPNADRDKETSSPINQATFLMSNMVAQSPDNNQGPWANLENDLRLALAGTANEMYIVSGPYGIGGTGANGGVTNTIANGHVTVPSSTWKVVLIMPKGTNDIARVTASTRTLAVLMPNVQGIRNTPWQTYITTVDAIEALTGYDFFSNLPDAIENAIEAGTDGTNPPGTEGQAVTTAEDNSVNITLTAATPSGSLTYTIVTPPAHGQLTGSDANRNYQPDPDYFGPDSFTFKVNNGSADSNTSTVSITVTEVNDAPSASDDSKGTNEDTQLNFSAADLTTNDSAGPANENVQTLTATSVTANANTHGIVTLNSGTVSYSPDANYNGPASFTYEVCDNGTTNGAADSKCTTATVNITVNPVNDGPTANGQAVVTSGNTPVGITLTGNDVETATANLIYTVTVAPTHGSLSGTGPNLIYTPAMNYSGPDSFKFTVTDTGDGSAAALTSSEGTVIITVNDTIAPTITLNGNIINLSPPNHSYRTVNVSDLVASAADNYDPTVTLNSVVIAKVTSDEAENGNGSGNTTNDIVIDADCRSVQLRAEREGGGDGRVYTITFKVTDLAGNISTATAKVYVPKSGNGQGAVDSGAKYTVNSMCP